ncbi:MAG: hypothetical protein VX335_03490 [Pseudomonadota bacterium]|nr:hypothetical protein [Pseudomonadota bacterium]
MFKLLSYFRQCCYLNNAIVPEHSSILDPTQNNSFSNEEMALYHLVRGEQDKLRLLLISAPNLLARTFDIVDFGGNVLNNVTLYQYAIWSWDWHMCVMFTQTFPEYYEVFAEQYNSFKANRCTDLFQFNVGSYLGQLENYVNTWEVDSDWMGHIEDYQKVILEKLALPFSLAQELRRAFKNNYQVLPSLDSTRFLTTDLPDHYGRQESCAYSQIPKPLSQSEKYLRGADFFNREYYHVESLSHNFDANLPMLELVWFRSLMALRQKQFKKIATDFSISTKDDLTREPSTITMF